MKALLFALTLFVTGSTALAQQKPPASPAMTDSVSIGGKAITINYGSPGVKGRVIFGPNGRLAKDGTYPIWRAGANSATTLHTDADLMLGSLHVPKGDYTLYVNLADVDNWELVVSKLTKQWGTVYKAESDLGRVKMKMSKPKALVENLVYKITPTGKNKGTLRLAWENKAAEVPIRIH